ncbi:MAG TPA: transposase [Nitrospira sp.]|nr:transposase [Nitrospira sp.]
MLVDCYRSLLETGWASCFAQARTLNRAIEHALASPCVMGRRTISRTICALGRQDQDWSAHYKMFSRSDWNAETLFELVMADYLKRYPERPVVVAIDDTKIAKTGKHIRDCFWQRDPMSPPFWVNLIYGQRFIQAGLIFPHYTEADQSPRSIPIRFTEAPTVKKPGKNASDSQKQEYKRQSKLKNLSTQTLEVINSVRSAVDRNGGTDRVIFAAMDGSFCNRTIFGNKIDRIELLARCRKDARLCFPAPPGSQRKYDDRLFTPEEVRKDENRPWLRARIHFGGEFRDVRYKEIRGVLWRRGAGTRPLRLIVIAPQPYRVSKLSRVRYRQPAYLLSTDTSSPAVDLVRACFDRWQIEVNHREEKDTLGVGQAQVRSPLSVDRHPAFTVASYSILLLAALNEFGPGRTTDYLPLPKWRKNSKRPSLLDMLSLLRKQTHETSDNLLGVHNFAENALVFANT